MCTFDRQLNSGGKGSIGWGVFTLAIGLFITGRGGWGWINIGFGLLLIATGIYEMKVREPKVIRVSAAVLGLLAVWNIGIVLLSFYFHTPAIGHGLWFGIMQALGAAATWKQYDVYVKLRETADPLAVSQVQQYLNEIRSGAESVVQFKAKPLLGAEQRWSVRFIDDLAFMVHANPGIFGTKGSIKEALWIPKNQLRVQNEGDRWIGSDAKATVFIAQAKIEKAIFARDMLQRMETQV